MTVIDVSPIKLGSYWQSRTRRGEQRVVVEDVVDGPVNIVSYRVVDSHGEWRALTPQEEFVRRFEEILSAAEGV
ncbi:MAG: hypothetical protein EBR82_33385 [Caulobacteraceae bacterium]|nr:hypothetical protein [Caulobacteraceae bacterium]